MKNSVMCLIFVFFATKFYSQNLTVRYVNNIGQIIEMPTSSITSDFDRRFSACGNGSWSPSPWHREMTMHRWIAELL